MPVLVDAGDKFLADAMKSGPGWNRTNDQGIMSLGR